MEAELLIALALTIPLLGALGIWMAGAIPDLREIVTLLTAAALFGVVVLGLGPMILAGQRPDLLLIETFGGIEIAMAIEPLGMLFAGIASTLWIVNTVYSIGYMRGNDEPRQTSFHVWIAISIWSAIGIAFSANLLTLFLFYEILTLATYPLVAHHGDEESKQKARTYLVVLITTSMVLLLPAIIATFALTGTADFTAGGILADVGLSAGALAILYTAYIFGIGKAAVIPVHFWLPAAMVAPTPVSALLHAVAVVKAGVFSVVKITVYVFGLELLQDTGASQFIAYMGGATVVLASVTALLQDNFKKRLAYSTVSQLSYIVMAAALATPIAILGAAFHILAHAVSKITLFFAAGSIYTATQLTEVSQFDGIGRRMPVTLVAYLIGTLSLIGLPPLVGLWSKWWIGMGAVDAGQFWVVAVLMISSILNVAYLLPIFSRGMFAGAPAETEAEPGWEALGPGHDGVAERCSGTKPATGFVSQIREAPLPCVIAIGTTAFLCLAFFFGAGPIETLLLQITELPAELPAVLPTELPTDLPTDLPAALPAELPGDLAPNGGPDAE